MSIFGNILRKTLSTLDDEKLDKIANKIEKAVDNKIEQETHKKNKKVLNELNERQSTEIYFDNLTLNAETRVKLRDGREGFIVFKGTDGETYKVLIDGETEPINICYTEVEESSSLSNFDIKSYTRGPKCFFDMYGHRVSVGDKIIYLSSCEFMKEYVIQSINFPEECDTRNFFSTGTGKYDKNPLPYAIAYNVTNPNDSVTVRIDSIVKIDPTVTYYLGKNYVVPLPGCAIKYKGKAYKILKVKDNCLSCIDLESKGVLSIVDIPNAQNELEGYALNKLMSKNVVNVDTGNSYMYICKLGNGKAIVDDFREGSIIVRDRGFVIEESKRNKNEQRISEKISESREQQNTIIEQGLYENRCNDGTEKIKTISAF
ncbi:hypothetical protein [Clostridium perfringens]|uniref:hypothetical protein n=1 Tax=Clostridium perfringens TaxID=1502 RepID=UPI0024BCE83B|nr:hypothetical protein [Clostridium perfringens]